jgi:cell division protease FtsH
MINEAAINAVKEGRACVSQKDLFDAVEVVLVGKEKKDRIMSKEERRIVSYHEVGHALISALQKNSEPVQKITIVPRTMGALGYVMHVPEEEKFLNTEAELRDLLVGLVGGRAAEEIVFETVTTGAANDIERATSIARNMVTRFGMSKRFGLMGLATVESQYLEGRMSLTCSEATAAEIDAEVNEILRESYAKALELLRDNRDLMDKIADYLIEKETITGKEFMQIYRKEKGIPEPVEETEAKVEAAAPEEAKAEEAKPEEAKVEENKAEEPMAEESEPEEAKPEEVKPAEAEADPVAEPEAEAEAETKAEAEAEAEAETEAEAQEPKEEPKAAPQVGRFSKRVDIDE